MDSAENTISCPNSVGLRITFFFGFYVVVTNSLNKNKVAHFTGSEIVQWLAIIKSNNTNRVRTSLKHFCFFFNFFWQFYYLFWQFHCIFLVCELKCCSRRKKVYLLFFFFLISLSFVKMNMRTMERIL